MDLQNLPDSDKYLRKLTVDPKNLFATAILRQDTKVITQLLDSMKIDLNEPLPNGKTPLVEVIQQEQLPLVELLLKHGADPDQACEGYVPAEWVSPQFEQRTPPVYPIQAAMKGHDAKLVHALLSAGTNLQQSGLTLTEIAVTVTSQMENAEITVPYLLEQLKKEPGHGSRYRASLDRILVTAVHRRNVPLLQTLLTEGANPNHIHGQLPVLVLAANTTDLSTCRLLLENGANLNRVNFMEDELPLSAAIQAGWSAAVKTLIQLGANVTGLIHHNMDTLTFLHLAVMKRNIDITKELLGAGCPVIPAGKRCNTPLHLACQDEFDPHPLVALLLDHVEPGSHIINIKNSKGQSALFLAIQNRCVNCAHCLVNAGADVNTMDSNGQSALQQAIHMCSEELVILILSKGAKVNSVPVQGCSPLLHAVLLGDYTITGILMEEGADVTMLRKGTNESALHLAVASQSEEILEVLLETGELDINGQTSNGETPLMLAARGGTSDLCKLLISNGALLNVTDFNQEETALSLSVYFGKEDSACWLIIEGANLDLADHR